MTEGEMTKKAGEMTKEECIKACARAAYEYVVGGGEGLTGTFRFSFLKVAEVICAVRDKQLVTAIKLSMKEGDMRDVRNTLADIEGGRI